MQAGEALVAMTLFIGGFLMIFGIYYLRTRQHLAMIDKGMNPRESAVRPAPYRNLKWGLLLIGSGAGLLAAYIIDRNIAHEYVNITRGADIYRERTDENPALYFALIAIGGGIGLFISYLMEKQWWDKMHNEQRA